MMRKSRKIAIFAISLIIGVCSVLCCGPISNATEEMSISYNTHIQNIGWEEDYSKSNGEVSGTEGPGLRLEAIKIRLNNAEPGITLKYQVHVQNVGWQEWKTNGDMAGTANRALRLEGIRIKLEGTKNYKVQYRTHVQNIGWQDWQEDGEMAGTENQALRLEAIQIRIVKIDTPTVEYSSHISQIGWEANYSKANGQMSGTTGRALGVEAIKIKLNGVPANASIQYQAHVAKVGWQGWKSETDIAGTTGRGLHIEALKIKLNNLPGYSIRYRAHVQGIGWQDWKVDGDVAGTEGPGLRIEAIQIEIVRRDNTPPTIQLNGNSTVDVNLGSTYTDQGATATDNIDGNITSRIQTTSNVDTTRVGTYTVTYTVTDSTENIATETRTVNVKDYVTGIEIATQPTKLIYNYNEDLDLTGMVVKEVKKSGTKTVIANSSCAVTGYNKTTLGTQTLTVTCSGKTATFDVTVNNNITDIELTAPAKLNYKYDEDLDLTGMIVKAVMSSGIKTTVANSDCTVTGYSKTTLGAQTITVSYAGKTKTFEVNVSDYIASIEVTTPSKLVYNYDEDLDLTGMIVKQVMKSGAKSTVENSSCAVIGYSRTTLGTQTLTVTYSGKTATFDVTVNDYITDLEITTEPSKVAYNYDEDLNLTGMLVKEVMKSGAKNVVANSDCTVTGYSKTTLGTQTITVTYSGKIATFDVTVSDYITAIEITTEPSKLEYKYNEDLNLTGMVVKEVMKSGVKNVIANSSCAITGYTKTTLGTQTLTVTYSGKTATFDVSVNNYVTGIEITTEPNKTQYVEGQDIDLTGLVVKSIMANNEKVVITDDITVNPSTNITYGTDTVEVSYVTTNTIDDESATFTEEFDITVKKALATLVVSEEKDDGYAHEKFTYGTISSGIDEEDVNIEDLKYQVKNSLGTDITDQLVEDKKIVNVTFEEELLRPGEILIKVTAEQIGNYTIIPYVGTSINDENAIKAAEQAIEISYNPVIATAEILDFTAANVRVDKVIVKDVKFENAHGDELTNVANSEVQISGTGVEITLLDETGTPGSTVRKIQIKGTTQGTTTINAVLNKGTTNQTESTSIGTITVQAKAQQSLNMEEMQTITLLQQEPLTSQDNIVVEDEVPYTLIPIGLIDEDSEESKIKGNQLIIGNPTVTNPFGVKYTGYDPEDLISLLDVKMFKNGSSITTALDADSVGIALANGTTKSDLTGKNLILKYGTSAEISIEIDVEDLRISNLIITPENVDAVSELPTIENHVKTTIGSIQSGVRQKELTIADLSYRVENSLGTDITNQLINSKKIVNVTFEEEVARPGEILIKVETQQEGNYTIIPYVTVGGNEVSVQQEIESINNPIVDTADITAILTAELKVETTFENTMVFKNSYGDILQGVKASTISVTSTGLNITLLNNGNPIANQEEDVTEIQIVPQTVGNKTISIVVNKNTDNQKTITISNVNILPKDIVLSVNDMTKVYLYETQPVSSTYTLCDIDGVIYTLIPVSLSDGTKLKGNSLVIGNAQNGKLSLNISNDDTWSIDAKMFKNQTTVAQAAEDATYVGIALGAGYTEEELLGTNITLTYGTSTKTLAISE